MKVHIVSHTHWDREWYLPLGRFRQRLVALVDELLDDPPAPGESFLLDGQGVVLEDYLAVRPERQAELSALLREGRLEAGPWYVLADELIPGGEALTRNLLAGRRTLRALRAEAPPVLYCPDSFGHPAMLPLIAQGFGMRAVIAWRGYGGARWPSGDAAWWRAPDGSRALLLHLPPDGYEFGSNLPAEPHEAVQRWQRMRDVLAGRSRLGTVLVHNGADHHARQSHHHEAVAGLVAAAAPDGAHASSLTAFVQDALERAAASALPEVTGELRDSYGYTWTLQGTFGTRAAQKRTNARVERLLVRDAEPWAALARARGAGPRRALLVAAWRALLECHPHDTLCGCSTDEVARAADVRWDDARAQAEGVREDALHDLAGHDPAAARVRRADWMPVVLVRNRAARARQGIALLRVETFVADADVGPASAGEAVTVPAVLPSVDLPARHQVLDERLEYSRVESPRHYPDNDLVAVRDVLALVGEVPGYGIAPVTACSDAEAAEVRILGDTLANGIASFDITDLVGVECRHDAGDLYTPAIRTPAAAASIVERRIVHEGPLRAAVALEWLVPAAVRGAASRVTTTLSLDAGAPFVRITVAGDHRGEDQRIRILVRSRIPDPAVWADAAFGPVERRHLVMDAEDAAKEHPVHTAPLHRYVSLFGADAGATLYSDGLAEYEALRDGSVAVTLVRAVGALSRHDLPERPGHAGWPAPTPGAQCPGPFAAELALYPHGATRDAATIDAIERVADDVLLPLAGVTLRSALAHPAATMGVTLEGRGLAFSALKESEDGAWTIARCVNLLDEPVKGSFTFGWPVGEAQAAQLDESPLGALEVADARTVTIDAGPREVVTVLVR